MWGVGRCLWSLGALPELLVWDREGALHAGGGRPTDVYASFCGQLRVDWHFCQPADPDAKGVAERLQGYLETNFEPGRLFANELDYQLQLAIGSPIPSLGSCATARPSSSSTPARPCHRAARSHEQHSQVGAYPEELPFPM